jgi:hypothetical protein
MANKTTNKESVEDLEVKEVDKSNGTQTFEETRMEKVTEPVITEGTPVLDNSDPTKGLYVDNIESKAVVREKRTINEGMSAEGYQAYLDNLKKTNPAKYEAKREEIERKMADARKAK